MTAIIFVFLTVLSVVPLLFVHESKALRTVGNRMFFLIMEVNCSTIGFLKWGADRDTLAYWHNNHSNCVDIFHLWMEHCPPCFRGIKRRSTHGICGKSCGFAALASPSSQHVDPGSCGWGWQRLFSWSCKLVRLCGSIITYKLCWYWCSLFFIGWPPEAWDGPSTRANNGAGARGVPIPPGVPANGYYHYKRTTREVVPRY